MSPIGPPIRLTAEQRASLRKRITAAPGWRAVRERNNYRIETMRPHDLINAGFALGLDMPGITAGQVTCAEPRAAQIEERAKRVADKYIARE